MTIIPTHIVAVAVYPDRARITREGAVTLEPGSYRLEITELPRVLDVASVRAAARGTARARLLGVDTRRVHYVETPAEAMRTLETQVEALQDELAVIDARAARLNAERETLRNLTAHTETYARGLARGKIAAADQMALLDAVRERAATLDTAMLELKVERRAQERKLHKLQKDLKVLRGARGKDLYTATVDVEITRAGELTVNLTYMVSQAAWTPLYDVRLVEGDEATLDITYLAEVKQNTGEAWDAIALTLSTARPALAETLPELEPWYIQPYAPPPPPAPRREKRKAAAPMGAFANTGALMDEMEEYAAREPEPEDADVALAAVDHSGAAVTYSVPGRVTVPDDGEAHKVTVARISLQPELDYASAPKLVAAAYRRATVTNDSAYTLLPGKASLFAGDEFIGTTALALTAPGGEIELYLGVDDRVKVSRELTRRDVDKRLMRDHRVIRYAYEITVENLLKTKAKLLLQDQIPTARHEAIKVKLESVEPQPVEKADLGLVDWEIVLAPGEQRIVRFAFSVDYPRDTQIVGLP